MRQKSKILNMIIAISCLFFIFFISHQKLNAQFTDIPGPIIPPPISPCIFPNNYTIDFEDLSDGIEVYNQYADRGVIFLPSYQHVYDNLPKIFIPSDPNYAHSGNQGLTISNLGDEFPTTYLNIEFTAPQSKVTVYVGLDVNTHGEVPVYFRAYDQDENIVDMINRNLPPGPCYIENMLCVYSDSENIRRVEIQFSNIERVCIDDLGYSNLGSTPPQDTQPPKIQIMEPQDGQLFSFFEGENCFSIDGIIKENERLHNVQMIISSGNKSNTMGLGFRGDAPDFRFGFGAKIYDKLYEGENTITIFAEDWAGLSDQQSIKVTYAPIRQECKLLIITPNEFIQALLPLAEYKSHTGLPTNIIPLESIYIDQRFNRPGSLDLPERIRQAIFYAEKNYDTEYVMLVGDSDKFPVRYCLVRNEPYYEDFFIPSDLYYADIYGGDGKYYSWDGDGDGYYGEIDGPWTYGDNYYHGYLSTELETITLDWSDSLRGAGVMVSPFKEAVKSALRPDVAVGRIPASTIGEVAIYVKKVIDYENGTSSEWLRDILLLTGDLIPIPEWRTLAEETNDAIADYSLPENFRKYKYYSSQHPGSESERAAQVNSYLNQGVGFVSYIGNGRPYNLKGIYYVKDHINGLQNADRLPIVFAVSDYTSQFHFWQEFGYHTLYGVLTVEKYQDIYGNTPPGDPGYWTISNPEPKPIQPPYFDQDSCAEEFLVKHLTGAIGYIGCCTGIDNGIDAIGKFDYYQYKNMEAATHLARWFFGSFEVLRDKYYPEPVTLGRMWNRAIGLYIAHDCFYSTLRATPWIRSENFSNIHKFLLLGDPSLRVGGSPVKYDIDYDPGYYTNRPLSRLFYHPLSQDLQPQIFGHSNIPGTLKLFEGENLLAMKEMSIDGDFTISTSDGLSEGVHSLTIQFNDSNGNEVQRETIIVEIDNTTPLIEELFYPQSSTLKDFCILGKTDINSKVKLYEGNNILAPEEVLGTQGLCDEKPCALIGKGRFELKIYEPLPPGEHSFTLMVTDLAGNEKVYSEPLVVNILDPDPIGCDYDLPEPVVRFVDAKEYSTDSEEYIRYELTFMNKADYPQGLFSASPELPPCDPNNSNNRIRIEIYSCDESLLYNSLCSFSSIDDLENLWFDMPKDSPHLECVVVKFNDRLCQKIYCSGPVPPLFREPCENNSQCSETNYCNKPDGGCEGEGVCDTRPAECDQVINPVCGCDGITYDNFCEAAVNGVNISFYGACEDLTTVTMNMSLPAGWSMISLPVYPSDRRLYKLFPEAKGFFKFTGEYELMEYDDELEPGVGYWIRLDEAKTFSISGTPISEYRIENVRAGWSIIGGGSYRILPYVDEGRIRAIFKFEARYELLDSDTPFLPGHGYWVNLSDEADMVLDLSGPVRK